MERTEKIDYGGLLEEIEEYLKICNSKIKLKAILNLCENDLRISDLHNTIGSKSRGKTNECLNDLAELGLVTDTIGERSLTPLGTSVQHKIIELFHLFLAIKKHKEYWNTHLMSLPHEFLAKLWVFHDAKLIKNTEYDDAVVISKVRDMALNGKYFFGVISAYSKNYMHIVEDALNNGSIVALIINGTLFEQISQKDRKRINEALLMNYGRARIMQANNFDKFSMLFTDNKVALFLFKKDGSVEWNECLYSENRKAVTIAKEIFEFYEGNSFDIQTISYLKS